MNIIETTIPDVKLIVPNRFGDHRGFFMETWNQQRFNTLGLNITFVQDNHSRSSHGILRGLHYQIKNPQGKLVRVTQGKVFDVAVDIRQTSKTYGQWFGAELSDENNHMLWVPAGFAHGFYVMSESADFLYKCTALYAPNYERCIHWNDKTLNINWPLINNKQPILSEKDAQGAFFDNAEVFTGQLAKELLS